MDHGPPLPPTHALGVHTIGQCLFSNSSSGSSRRGGGGGGSSSSSHESLAEAHYSCRQVPVSLLARWQLTRELMDVLIDEPRRRQGPTGKRHLGILWECEPFQHALNGRAEPCPKIGDR